MHVCVYEYRHVHFCQKTCNFEKYVTPLSLARFQRSRRQMEAENIGFLMMHKSLLPRVHHLLVIIVRATLHGEISSFFKHVIFLSVALATSNGHLYLYEVNKNNERSKAKSSIYHQKQSIDIHCNKSTNLSQNCDVHVLWYLLYMQQYYNVCKTRK